MNPHLSEDTDDENCDDPIKLFDHDLNAVYYGSKPLAIRDITDTESRWRLETIENNDYFQPRENPTLVKPNDDPVEKTQSSAISEFDITPLCIKLVDCDKFPWYFNKYTQKIMEKINSIQHSDSEHNMDVEVILDDSDDCVIVEDLKDVTNEIHTSIVAKARSPGKMTNINKNRLYKHFEILKRRKADAEIKRALSAKNLVQVDLKRNQGLIGMKIIQKIETNKKLNIKAEGEKTEANQQHDVTADDKYVSAVDKTLGSFGTQLIPIVEEKESISNHPFTSAKKDMLGKPNLLKSPSFQNITVQFDISKISEKLLDNLKSKKIIDQSSEAKVLSQSSQFLQKNPETKITIENDQSSKAKAMSQTNQCLLENPENQNNIEISNQTLLKSSENKIKLVNDRLSVASVISQSNQALLKKLENKITLVNDQSPDAKVISQSNQTVRKNPENKMKLVNDLGPEAKVIRQSNQTVLKNPENKIKLVNEQSSAVRVVNEQSSDAKVINQPNKTLENVENKTKIVNDQLFEAKDTCQSNRTLLKYPENKTKTVDEKDLSSKEIITENIKKSSVKVTSHVKDLKKTNMYKKFEKKMNISSSHSSLVGLLVTNEIKDDIKETQSNKQKILRQAIQSINSKIVKKPRKKIKKQKSELKSPILPCSNVLKKTKHEIPLNKSDTNSNLSKELGRLAKIVDTITNSCSSMLDSNRPKPIVYPRKTPKSFDVPRKQSIRKGLCEMQLKTGSLSNVPVKPLKIPDKLPDICIDVKPNIDIKSNICDSSRIMSSSQNNTLNEQNVLHEPQQNNLTKHITNIVTNPTPKLPIKNNKPTACNSNVPTTTEITPASRSESVPPNKHSKLPAPYGSDVPTHNTMPSKMSNSNIPHKYVPVQNCNASTPILKSNNHTSLPCEKYCEPSAQTASGSESVPSNKHSKLPTPYGSDVPIHNAMPSKMSNSKIPHKHVPVQNCNASTPILKSNNHTSLPCEKHCEPSAQTASGSESVPSNKHSKLPTPYGSNVPTHNAMPSKMSNSNIPHKHVPVQNCNASTPILKSNNHTSLPCEKYCEPSEQTIASPRAIANLTHSQPPCRDSHSPYPKLHPPAPTLRQQGFFPNSVNPAPNQFHLPPNQFHPPRNQLHPPPHQFHPRPNQFHPRQNQFHPRPNQFQPCPNQFQPRPNQFQPRPNQFHPHLNQFRPHQDFIGQQASNPMQDFYRECWLPQEATGPPQPPPLMSINIPPRNGHDLNHKAPLLPNQQNDCLQTSVTKPQVQNSSIIGMNNDGLVKKITISAMPVQNNANTNKGIIKVEQIMSPTEEDKEVAVTKTEMLKELDNLSFVDGNSFKEINPATIINGHKNNSTLEVASMTKKPGGRFETLKLTMNSKDNRMQSQEPAKGYSPPILPIPTYQKVLSERVILNSRTQNVKPKVVVPPQPGNPKPNSKSETKPMRKRDFVKCCKRKLAWTNDEERKRSEDAKKISLEEYKKRIGKNDCKSNNNRNFIREKFKNRKKGDSTESDLGYDSDSTVIL